MNSTHEPTQLVYCYQTYLPLAGAIVPVHSARPATLDLIESIDAVAVMGSAREARRSEICELGFFRGAPRCGHDAHASN